MQCHITNLLQFFVWFFFFVCHAQVLPALTEPDSIGLQLFVYSYIPIYPAL